MAAATGLLWLCGLTVGAGTSLAAGTQAGTFPRPSEASVVKELPELRTASSDTYERSDGTRVVKTYATPVNFRDSAGAWAPIEEQLTQDANGALHPRASGVPVTLPASLGSGPVSFGAPGAELSLSLQGASALDTVSASGAEGRYPEALPGVEASYRLGASGLRDTLTLQSATAPSVYRYALSLSPGLHAVDEPWGGFEIQDAAGNPRYRLAPPTVADSSGKMALSGEVHYELSEDQKTLSVVLNSSWLHSSARVFPVRIDPDVSYYEDELDCDLHNGSEAGTSYCGDGLYVGSEAGSGAISRALIRFNLTSLPGDSQVLGTRMTMYWREHVTSTPQSFQAYALEHKFTANATWNSYDGAHAWPKGGGDEGALALPTGGTQAYGERTYPEAEFHNWPEIGITPLVQKWVSEPASNDGLLIKDKNEADGEYDRFDQSGAEHGGPSLEVLYNPRVGSQGDQSYTGFSIDDRAGVSVNLANGNLLADSHGFELPGIGYNFSADEIYNNLTSYAHTTGDGSSLSSDVYFDLEPYYWDETLLLHEASGKWVPFTREPSADSAGNKAYLSPAGTNATLLLKPEDQAELTYTLSRVKYIFQKNEPRLEKIVDPNGNTTSFEYDSEGRTSKVTDTHGHVLKYTYEGYGGDLSKITDPLGRTWKFSENSSNELTSMTDPDGHELKYAYDEAVDLKQITDPDGHLTEISYSGGRVTQIRRVINGSASSIGSRDAITTFAYATPAASELKCPEGTIGDTVVVSPDGSPNGEVNSKASEHKTSYCFNAADEITKTIDQAGNASTASYNSAFGELTKYQNPGDTAKEGKVTNTIAYASNGAVESIIEGTGESSSLKSTFSYTGGFAGVEPGSLQTPRSASTQTAAAHTTNYGYDTNGNVNSVKQGATGPEVKVISNSHGQPEKSYDGDGHETTYAYNVTSKDLEKITPPAPLGTTELSYDSIDRLHSAKDGRSNTATYKYDGEDRVTKVEYSDGSSVSFEYDADGNVLKRTDAAGFGEPYTGATYYEYDKLNRPVLETTPTGKSMTYGYDYDGNLTSLKDGGGTVTYAYGPDDVLTSLIEPENSGHPFKFGYAAGTDGRESMTYPNGLLQCAKDDPAGRLKELFVFKPSGEQNCASSITPSATLEDYALSYTFEEELEGEKITIDTPDLQTLSNLKAGTATKYGYDELDRLLKAVSKPGSEAATLTSEYEYDKAGNMTLNHTYSPSMTDTNEHMFYNAANEICAIATTAPTACPASEPEPGIAGEPTYDKGGDMTSDGLLSGANKFAYTVRDQLSSITPHGESAKAVVSHGTGQEDLAAIGSEEVITNVLGVGVTGSGESAKYYTRGSGGELLAKRTAKGKPSETEYFALDPFGSVAMLTSSGGTQTAPGSGIYQYDPYGASVGSAPATFGFHSAQTLPTGVTHYGARYYDPMLGSWTQQDPLAQISDILQADRFSYAADDPINESDPSGACVIFSCSVYHKAEHFVTNHYGTSAEIRRAKESNGVDIKEKAAGCVRGAAEFQDESGETGLAPVEIGKYAVGCASGAEG